MSILAERVDEGAALLDEKLPGWAERINLAQLDLASCYQCVLGQLFAFEYDAEDGSPYGAGVRALDIPDISPSWYGFDGADANALNAEWRRVITERTARAPAGTTT